jgi:hypothetical protein
LKASGPPHNAVHEPGRNNLKLRESRIPPAWLTIIDRRTGEIRHKVPVPAELNPHLLPPEHLHLWHYLEFRWFELMLINKRLHMKRLDNQSDTKDGEYSSANCDQWSPVVAALMEVAGIDGRIDPGQLRQTNEILRKRSFIHCWSRGQRDSAWMWEKFLGAKTESLAICTTLHRLHRAVRCDGVEFLRVLYFAPGQPHLDYSYSAPMMSKRQQFFKERELRLLAMRKGSEAKAGFMEAPINPRALIKRVVVHPLSGPAFRMRVRKFLDGHGISAFVAKSTLTASDLIAVRQSRWF